MALRLKRASFLSTLKLYGSRGRVCYSKEVLHGAIRSQWRLHSSSSSEDDDFDELGPPVGENGRTHTKFITEKPEFFAAKHKFSASRKISTGMSSPAECIPTSNGLRISELFNSSRGKVENGNGVPASKVNGNGVPASKVKGNGVPASKVNGNGVPASKVNGNGVPASKVDGNGVPASMVIGNGVSASKVNGNGVPASKVNGNGVPASKVNSNGVPASKVNGNGVPASKVNSNGVPASKVNSNGVPASKVNGNGVPASKVDGNGVPASKVDDNGVSASKVKGNGVPASKVNGNGVLQSKVNSNGVPASKVNSNGVPASKVNGNGVPASMVNGNGVPASMVKGNGVPVSKVNGIGVPESKIKGYGVPASKESTKKVTVRICNICQETAYHDIHLICSAHGPLESLVTNADDSVDAIFSMMDNSNVQKLVNRFNKTTLHNSQCSAEVVLADTNVKTNKKNLDEQGDKCSLRGQIAAGFDDFKRKFTTMKINTEDLEALHLALVELESHPEAISG